MAVYLGRLVIPATDSDLTPNVHPVAVRVRTSLLRGCVGEARGCVADLWQNTANGVDGDGFRPLNLGAERLIKVA